MLFKTRYLIIIILSFVYISGKSQNSKINRPETLVEKLEKDTNQGYRLLELAGLHLRIDLNSALILSNNTS